MLDRVAPGAQALVAFHHPLVELHSPIIDAIRQHGSERLAAVLGRHPQVVAVLCGHAHTAAASTFAGRPLLVAPGVVSTVRLPWERRGHIDAQLPALAFHILDDAGVSRRTTGGALSRAGKRSLGFLVAILPLIHVLPGASLTLLGSVRRAGTVRGAGWPVILGTVTGLYVHAPDARLDRPVRAGDALE